MLALLVGAIIVSVICVVLWIVGLIPALVRPQLFSFFSGDSVTYYVSKKMLRAAMRKESPKHEKVL
jgi:hypothetical protein